MADASGYAAAVRDLNDLASLPETDATPAQQTAGLNDVTALNSFFSTNGLYDVSAPSDDIQAFVGTLQQEVRSGWLSAVPITAAIPDATVTCPVLSSLAVGTAFGCRINSPAQGQYTFIGEIQGSDATTYLVYIAKGEPAFSCGGLLDASEEVVLREIGGSCA
jgi:hypothetical protein